MIKYIIILAAVFSSQSLLADEYVNGYFRNDGTYVSPHYRSFPNNSVYDNYSYPGNYNPNTTYDNQQYQAPNYSRQLLRQWGLDTQ